MPTTDLFAKSNALDSTAIETLACRLEARKDSFTYMQMLRDYLALLELPSRRDVLALGAGTGVEVRDILQREDFTGHITALELSPHLVIFGKARCAEEGLASRVTWMTGDARRVDLPDASFDLVLAHTLLSHVEGPERVVSEAVRLLRPDGKFVIFDGDYATLTFGTDDAAHGEAWDAKIIKALIANPRIMRMLPRIFVSAGLKIDSWRSYAFQEVGKADFFLASLRAYPVLLPTAGVATLEEVTRFVDDQLAASKRGAFYAGYNFMTYICRHS